MAKAEGNTAPNAWLIAAFAAVFLLLSLAVGLSPQKGEDVAVLLPSGKTAALVLRSGGTFVRAAWAGRVLIARSDDPHFSSRLYANGAVFVFNPRVVAGCQG